MKVAINLKTKEVMIFNNGETQQDIAKILTVKEGVVFDRRAIGLVCKYNNNPKNQKLINKQEGIHFITKTIGMEN